MESNRIHDSIFTMFCCLSFSPFMSPAILYPLSNKSSAFHFMIPCLASLSLSLFLSIQCILIQAQIYKLKLFIIKFALQQFCMSLASSPSFLKNATGKKCSGLVYPGSLMTMTDSTLVVEHRWLLLQGDLHGVLLSRPPSGTMCHFLRRHQDFLFPWKWRKATLRMYSRQSLTSQWPSCKGNILISTPGLENYI